MPRTTVCPTCLKFPWQLRKASSTSTYLSIKLWTFLKSHFRNFTSCQILTSLITTLRTSADPFSPRCSAFDISTSGEIVKIKSDFYLYCFGFSYNHLEKIQSFSFGKIPTLLDLDLSHNRIVDIRRGAFGNLVSIRSLYLDHNMLDEIPRPPISLNHLHMSHNKVRWENISEYNFKSVLPL